MPVNKPAIDELDQKVGGSQPLIDPKDMKPVSIAVEEINRGLLAYHRNLEDEEE